MVTEPMLETAAKPRRPRSIGKWLRRIRKWAPWIVYSLSLPILMFEVIARLAFPSYADDRLYFPTLASKVMMANVNSKNNRAADKRYYYRLQPYTSNRYYTHTYTTNSLGFRCPEPSPKQPGEYRIMLIGDSATFGQGLDEEDTIAAQIQRLGRERSDASSPIAAYNFGVPGYNLAQELIVLRDYFDIVKPDHIILILSVYTDNLADAISDLDAEGNFIVLKEQSDRLAREIASHYGPLNWSMLFRMFQLKFLSTRIYYLLSQRPEIARKSFALIDSFADECWRRGIPFTAVNVYSPDAVKGGLHQLWNGSRKVHAMYTRYCRDHDIQIVDMLRYMDGYSDWKKYYFGEGHPNAPGARRIAESIIDEALESRVRATAAPSGPSSKRHPAGLPRPVSPRSTEAGKPSEKTALSRAN
jgi:hypothetical protein